MKKRILLRFDEADVIIVSETFAAVHAMRRDIAEKMDWTWRATMHWSPGAEARDAEGRTL